MTRRTLLKSIAVYVAVVIIVAGFVALRVKARYSFAAQTAPESLPYAGRTPEPPDPHAKPFFSLHTNRTYATTDRARVWVNYRGVESLDFRIYKVKDPVKFFRQLDDPHQVGEDEQEEVGKQVKQKPTFLERLRQFKSWGYGLIKTYVRQQLQNQSRKGFNQKFRPEEDDTSFRTPLNVSTDFARVPLLNPDQMVSSWREFLAPTADHLVWVDFARVPLLNPDQMVSSWREKLPPLEDKYDRRSISLGKREPGVYLVEAVSGDLRAFGIVIVSDLATVEKTSSDGSMLVYAVERTSGQPREGVQVQVIRKKNDVTGGKTDKRGLLNLKVEDKTKAANKDEEDESAVEEGAAPLPEDETTTDSYLVMATEGDNFAI